MTLLQLETTAATATFICAGAAMILFLLELSFRQALWKVLGMIAMGGALVGATATLGARWAIAQHVPWSNLWESMIFMLFATLVVYFVVEWWYRPKNFGVAAAPLVLVLIGGASILPPGLKGATPLMPALQSYWIKIHTSAILVSYAAFTMAFAASLAYFFFAWRDRQATPALAAPGGGGGAAAGGMGGGRYDAQLQFFDELSYRLILVGFPLLMFGIITGAMWANGAWGTYWSWDPKETWSLITWFIYAAYLHARISRDWVGQKAATLAVVGFVSMIITYIGVNYLSTGLHSYGFIK